MNSESRDAGRPLRLGPRSQFRLAVELVGGPNRGLSAEPRSSGSLQIGRATDNELQLKGEGMAAYHLELTAHEGGAHVEDLGSASGTWFDELRIERAMVPYGSELRVGEHRLRVDGATTVELEREELPSLSIPTVAFARRYREALALGARFASGRVPVLLQGEPGAGKRFLARVIHEWSGREGPWVECSAAGDATAVAARIFGHTPGSHRGASAGGEGAIQRAKAGTLYVSDVDRMPPETQGMLARALRDGATAPLGSNQAFPVDARWVFGCSQDLRRAVNQGYFLEELYFRIAAARVTAPPLRDRLEDLELLVRHFEGLLNITEPLGPGQI
ncbi:MAG: sigma 54-interacting transcriptional regulator, partial [Myxococcales bacterium]|nr:sigma 54-interacting transcriptional regulator [Myxococcales bacterium]